MTAAPINVVLDRLAAWRLRETGPDRWRACCPSHNGKNPSALSIGVGDGGGVLLRCWHGCHVADIASALGLDVADLFPPRPATPGFGASPMRRRRMMSPAQALGLLEHEATLCAVVAGDMAAGKEVADFDLERVLLAAARIVELRDECIR
jgi:hypothetical protein